MIYDSIDTLPAYNFYKVIETCDYKYLFDDMVIVDGIDLEAVMYGFTECINEILNIKNDLHKEELFLKLRNKYVALSNIVSVLKIKEVKDGTDENYNYIVKWLKTNGYKYDDSTFETKYECIQEIERQMQGLRTKIDLHTPIQKDTKQSYDFYDMNVKLSKFVGYQINMKQVSIREYVSIIKDYSNNK